MTRDQRSRYEMFVRVRDFGTAHRDAFPASASGGQMFDEVTTAVATIEDQLKQRVLARAEAQRVKKTTRQAVVRYMRAVARTGRQVTASESGMNPFRLPERLSASSVLSTARAFIQEAGRGRTSSSGWGCRRRSSAISRNW